MNLVSEQNFVDCKDNPHSVISINKNNTYDDDRFIRISYDSKNNITKTEILSKLIVFEIYKQQEKQEQKTLEQQEMMKREQKVLNEVSAKSGYVD